MLRPTFGSKSIIFDLGLYISITPLYEQLSFFYIVVHKGPERLQYQGDQAE
jgi:hypothetical protein